jgi:hypothetical protein
MRDSVDWLGEVALDALTAAGWSPARNVDTTPWREQILAKDLPWFEAAELTLRSFGGLDVRSSGEGLDFARLSVDLDPIRSLRGLRARAEYESMIGRPIVLLGVVDDAMADLAITDTGEVYLLMDGNTTKVGRTIHEALNNLLSGKRPPPGR